MTNPSNSKAVILAILLGVLAIFTSGRVEALEKDKQQHIAVSALIGVAAAISLEDTDHPVLYGAAVAMLPGAAKELYDARHPDRHSASGADLVADAVGAVAGAWFGSQVQVHLGPQGVSFSLSGEF